MGPFSGEEGDLSASVVGAEEHGNERVAFLFVADDTDTGMDIDPANLDEL